MTGAAAALVGVVGGGGGAAVREDRAEPLPPRKEPTMRVAEPAVLLNSSIMLDSRPCVGPGAASSAKVHSERGTLHWSLGARGALSLLRDKDQYVENQWLGFSS